MTDLVGVRSRISQLAGDNELHGYVRMDETDAGVYYAVLRSWPHPEVDGATTLSLRYAYLTKGDGSDGWTEDGVNMRVASDVELAGALKTLAKLFMSGHNQVAKDVEGVGSFDVRED